MTTLAESRRGLVVRDRIASDVVKVTPLLIYSPIALTTLVAPRLNYSPIFLTKPIPRLNHSPIALPLIQGDGRVVWLLSAVWLAVWTMVLTDELV